MVVDDDKLIRELTVTALSYCVNREVKSFDSASRAMDYMEQGAHVDIILSDVDMPGMDGLQFMARVRKINPETVFIVMSGQSTHEASARLAGAAAFLAKPFDINDLFGIVQCYVVDPV